MRERIKGLCSVILPVYNSQKYVEKTILSVLSQSYSKLELIIIDDFSLDNSRKIIEKFRRLDQRIIVIYKTKNTGCADSRNKGMEIASGEYVAFIDSDDIWMKNKLELQIKYLELNRLQAVSSSYLLIDENNDVIKARKIKSSIDYKSLLKENQVIFSSLVVRNNIISNIKFNSKWFHEDYVFLLNLTKMGIVISSMSPCLIKYRVHNGGRSFNKLNAARNRWIIYRNYLQFNLLKSLYYFVFYAIKGIIKYV